MATKEATLEIKGQETVIEAAERTGKQKRSSRGKKAEKVAETETAIEVSPKDEKESFYALNKIDDVKVKVAYRQVKAVSRMRYVQDIHVASPQIIEETHYAILKDHRSIVVFITQDQFNKILEHPSCQKIQELYAYTSMNEQPRPRQYTIDHEGWPTVDEIRKYDNIEDELAGVKKARRREPVQIEPVEIPVDPSMVEQEEILIDAER